MEEKCRHCDGPVQVMAFRGTGICSVDCRKALGLDVSSVGTMMFVTTEEKEMIGEYRGT
jgi:hypothetical protein